MNQGCCHTFFYEYSLRRIRLPKCTRARTHTYTPVKSPSPNAVPGTATFSGNRCFDSSAIYIHTRFRRSCSPENEITFCPKSMDCKQTMFWPWTFSKVHSFSCFFARCDGKEKRCYTMRSQIEKES